MQKGGLGGDTAAKKWITYILLVIAWIPLAILFFPFSLAVPLGVRFFTHMLQLSSYQLPGYFRYLKKSGKARIVLWLCAFGMQIVWQGQSMQALLQTGKKSLMMLPPAIAFAVLMMTQFWPRTEKKKFVVTPRVRRLFVTITLLFYVIWGLAYLIAFLWLCAYAAGSVKMETIGQFAVLGLFSLGMGLLPFLVALANRINGPVEKSINNGFVNDAVRILKEQPKLRIIGVTGSYGKTSVKYYLTTILSEQFNVLMTPESYNTPMGVVRTIREQMKPLHEIFVCEMGARHVGDIKEITDFVHPDDGVLTAIGEQHMETFFTQENIVKTKYELLDAVEEKYPAGEGVTAGGGLKFVNGDNETIRANMKYPDAITYGLAEGNDFRAIDLKVTGSGTTFKIQLSRQIAERLIKEQGYTEGETDVTAGTEFHTVLVGAHNIQNITGAIAVATMYGIPASKIRMGVRRIEPVPHRLELKKHGNVTIMDDAFNSNPAGAKAALDTLAMFENAVKILVTPGMVELGGREDALNEAFGEQAAAVCDYIILVGEKQTAAVKKGITGAGFDEQRLFVKPSFNEASVLMYELDAGREKVILLENDLPDNY